MKSKKQIKKKGISTGKVVAIGAGLATLGAGAYYFLGPNGTKNRKNAKVWMTSMKKEVEKKVALAQKVTAPVYHKIVDTISDTYSAQHKEHKGEIEAFANYLKLELKDLKSQAKPIQKVTKKIVKKATKKAKNILTKKKPAKKR